MHMEIFVVIYNMYRLLIPNSVEVLSCGQKNNKENFHLDIWLRFAF